MDAATPPDEKKAPEVKAVEQKAPESKPAEQPVFEMKIPGQPAPVVKTPEQVAAEEKAAAEQRLAARQEEERKAAAQKALDRQYLEAAKKGNLTELKGLLGKGAALLANDDGNTALFYAAQFGRKDAVEFLLDAGIPLNVKNRIGSTPLTGAAGGGHKEVAWELYMRGADPNEKNLTGMSPLNYARSASYTDMIELLSRPRNPVEVVLSRPVGDRTLQEIFNFTREERISLIRKGEEGPVEAMQRDSFSDITDKSGIREAFNIYKKRGGTITEAAIFPRKPEPVQPEPKKKRLGLF
ncbi:MAG: ankyrin repeat domain-containing protein [Alphaproteobacteria bacterium]|nr:MAG: ankyrin repeat domain-containing protein [Alphaproteobacteria bacterium]